MKPHLLLFVLTLLTPHCAQAYILPAETITRKTSIVRVETNVLADSINLERAVDAAELEFLRIQEGNLLKSLTYSTAARRDAGEILANCMAPFGDKQLGDILDAVLRETKMVGWGLGTFTLPEVHVWTSETFARILATSDLPPGVFKTQNGGYRCELISDSGDLFPWTLIVNTAEPTEKWGGGVEAATAACLAALDQAFTARNSAAFLQVLESTASKALHRKIQGPEWLISGIALYSASNASALLIGERATQRAYAILYPDSSPGTNSAALSVMAKRKNHERVLAFQNETRDEFLKKIAAQLDRNVNRSITDDDIVKIYRSLRPTGKLL